MLPDVPAARMLLGKLARRGRRLSAVAILLLGGCSIAPGSGGDGTDDATVSKATSVGIPPSISAPPNGDVTAEGEPTSPASSAPTGRARPTLTGRVLVLDPGHNGGNGEHAEQISRLVDAGGFEKPCNTVGTRTQSGYLEATFNWRVTQLLAGRLRAAGATVVLTRNGNDGWGPCVDARGKTAATKHADLLLSIHADGAPSTAHGFHVISPARLDGYTTAAAARESAVLARAIRDAMVGAGFETSTYAGRDGLVVRSDLGTLNLAGTPAAMVECGNMLNRADAALMESAAGRNRIAAALAAAIRHILETTPHKRR